MHTCSFDGQLCQPLPPDLAAQVHHLAPVFTYLGEPVENSFRALRGPSECEKRIDLRLFLPSQEGDEGTSTTAASQVNLHLKTSNQEQPVQPAFSIATTVFHVTVPAPEHEVQHALVLCISLKQPTIPDHYTT